jgi:cytochrome b subunit of formate dehydrogenase
MDADTKVLFKWKFYRLTIELNIIIMLVAASVLVFFIVRSRYTMALVAGMLVLAFMVSVDFIRKYRETKAWLDENSDNGKGAGHRQAE